METKKSNVLPFPSKAGGDKIEMQQMTDPFDKDGETYSALVEQTMVRYRAKYPNLSESELRGIVEEIVASEFYSKHYQ